VQSPGCHRLYTDLNPSIVKNPVQIMLRTTALSRINQLIKQQSDKGRVRLTFPERQGMEGSHPEVGIVIRLYMATGL